ncbi:MAG: UDP-4-amino-4,6-dideoxy-N-acetyl-beta-L-altrosamine transaminase [Campylobacterales bacterium]|nr:UDP-4-amino-4,6-dideoxy-N-acetyl-beta-L-altrosamine transaminase [Campylobacterales bacterium]
MIPYSCQSINNSDIDAVIKVLQSSHLTQGKMVEQFENAICQYIGCKYAITFNSATSALLAAYKVAGLKEGDEVITSPLSFVATSNMLLECNATPVWCDIKLDGNIDERFVTRAITEKTKAIVAIDFAGKPVAIKSLQAIAKEHNLLLIEDASHAFGSMLEDKKIGTFSDMSIFSFHAIKPLTTGEGGCVVTNDENFAKALQLFRSHGIVKKELWNSDMVSMGHNYRLTEFAAALGNSQLQRIDAFIAQREKIARYYDKKFANHKLFTTLKIDKNTRSSRHLYVILLSPNMQCVKEEIFQALHERGIGVQVHYKPIYKNSYYIERFGELRLDVCEDFYRSELSIPCHQKMSMDNAEFIATTLLEIFEKYAHRGCSF